MLHEYEYGRGHGHGNGYGHGHENQKLAKITTATEYCNFSQ
jgi:hypothetical protein